MRKIFALLVVASFITAGCASTGQKPVEVYTFKKDRVDQEITGNRGYLKGTPPPLPEDRDTQRTLIGVDIELPARLIGEDDEEAGETVKTEPEKAPAPVKKTPTKPKKACAKEEGWIK
ncbi:MAG: hypothetical protein ABID83_01645 [Candidatus Omnitrophota bacterium]